MEFNNIAETIGAKDLLIFIGVLIGIVTAETTLIWSLIYRVGGLRKLFYITASIFNNRRHNARNKGDETTPNVKNKKGFQCWF